MGNNGCIIEKKWICFLTINVLMYNIYAQNDTLKRQHFFICSGINLNTYINNKFNISKRSPLLAFMEVGIHRNIDDKYSLQVSVNYQPFYLKSYYSEFYDRYNWTSVGIKASYLFHKLNFSLILNRQFSRLMIGAGAGLSYTIDSKFVLENFGCAYPYGSVQYQNIRQYYYSAFNNDNKGVIIYRVLDPYINLNAMYKILFHFYLKTDIKYELSKVPDNNSDWSLFRITPITLGVLYQF